MIDETVYLEFNILSAIIEDQLYIDIIKNVYPRPVKTCPVKRFPLKRTLFEITYGMSFIDTNRSFDFMITITYPKY